MAALQLSKKKTEIETPYLTNKQQSYNFQPKGITAFIILNPEGSKRVFKGINKYSLSTYSSYNLFMTDELPIISPHSLFLIISVFFFFIRSFVVFYVKK